jgi:glycosyltransferase involved in cell wall biosynthesis
MNDSFAILIATRNRPLELSQLLNSISKLEKTPKIVVIVSSGNSIASTIAEHANLNITHQHISEYGQIRQKMIGIKMIPQDIDWVLFLDDDLLLDSSSTKNLFDFITHSNQSNLLGLGLSDSSVTKLDRKRFLPRRKPGSVTQSGINVSYMASKDPVQTTWLNGASMWSKQAVNMYHFDYLESKYSICEDLIFSYSMSRLGTLYYVPNAKFQFQSGVKGHVEDFEIFSARAYWKYYFVSKFESLSSKKFLAHQILATVAFVCRSEGSSLTMLKRITLGGKVFIQLLRSELYKKNAFDLLSKTAV